MGLWGKKLEPETVEEVLGGAYKVLAQLEHVQDVNEAKAKDARDEAYELRVRATVCDQEADGHQAEAERADKVHGNFKKLLGK